MDKRFGALCLSVLLSSAVMIRAGKSQDGESGSDVTSESGSDVTSESDSIYALTSKAEAEDLICDKYRNDDKFTCLHAAAAVGDFDAVVSYKGKSKKRAINAVDGDGKTPLNYAVKYGHEGIVDILLQKGAKSVEGSNVVTEAVDSKRWTMALSLLAHGMRPTAETARSAIQKNHYSVLAQCVASQAFNIDWQDPETGNTLLMESVQKPSYDQGMAYQLLQNGARGDIANKKGYLPIHLAVACGMLNTVKLLLAQNTNYAIAPIKKDTERGAIQFCPLTLYCVGPKPVDAIADELYQAGATVEGLNLAEVLINVEDDEDAHQVFDKLCELGVSTETPTKLGQTPLMIALSRNFEDIASRLIDEQDSPKEKDNDGFTLLHFAAAGGARASMLKTIIDKYNISVDVVDDYGATPLDEARFNGQDDTIAALLELGADANKKRKEPENLDPIKVIAKKYKRAIEYGDL